MEEGVLGIKMVCMLQRWRNCVTSCLERCCVHDKGRLAVQKRVPAGADAAWVVAQALGFVLKLGRQAHSAY